jgi:hypothetical protein
MLLPALPLPPAAVPLLRGELTARRSVGASPLLLPRLCWRGIVIAGAFAPTAPLRGLTADGGADGKARAAEEDCGTAPPHWPGFQP